MSKHPLSVEFNVAVLHIASKLFPNGFDVSSEAPDTFEKLKDHVAHTGRMLVWNGASEQTIFADNEVNFAFRAWHDWCHLHGNCPFTTEGERDAAEIQVDHIRTLYGYTKSADRMVALIRAEVIGQVAYHEHHSGEFPTNQAAFVRDYLIDPISAVISTY